MTLLLHIRILCTKLGERCVVVEPYLVISVPAIILPGPFVLTAGRAMVATSTAAAAATATVAVPEVSVSLVPGGVASSSSGSRTPSLVPVVVPPVIPVTFVPAVHFETARGVETAGVA